MNKARRKSKTQALIESTLGQHLGLSVASHLARTQLVANLSVYDAQHLEEMLDVVANALIRVVPVYTREPKPGSEPRQLLGSELDGACAQRGATLVCLRDGRRLAGVTIKRADLRHGLAILRAVGIPELGVKHIPPDNGDAARAARWDKLRAEFAEIEALLDVPITPAQAQLATVRAISLARAAPHGTIANLAMYLINAVHGAGGGAQESVPVILDRLRAALDEAGCG